jgi:hypothetical protein
VVTRFLVRLLLRPIVIRLAVRAMVPWIGIPLFAAINAYATDHDIRNAWTRLLGLPTAVEILEELLVTAKEAKQQLYGNRAATGQASQQREKMPHWAPMHLQHRLAKRSSVTMPWGSVQTAAAEPRKRRTASAQFDLSAHITATLENRVIQSGGADPHGVARQRFYDRSMVPTDSELDALGASMWGAEASGGPGRERLREWFQSKTELMRLSHGCSSLEPDGWDQLRRCIGCLVVIVRLRPRD